jgi:hypothetical protein
MNIKKLIKKLKKYEKTNCDVRIQIDDDNFFNNSCISTYFDKATKLNISDHLSLPNYWIDDLELSELNESNELVLWGKYQ